MEGTILFEIKSDGKILDLIQSIENNFTTIKNKNLIINIENASINEKDFLSLLKTQQKQKKSLVIVSKSDVFEPSIEDLNIVPTLQEAYDVIEIEEIERDLGF